MNAFPPEDISGFLQLSAGDWLALRSVLGPDGTEPLNGDATAATERPDSTHHWHQSDRGELRMACLEPQTAGDWGGLAVELPGGATHQLIFQTDGTLVTNGQRGRWTLAKDGTLELVVVKEACVVNERVWFSKPNLRLRCTLEQFLDGQPGRASFSSEIRRVQRQQEPRPAPPA